jgi:NADP-dependent 3-hydroxy acid dehydrogenase YdfG
MPDTDPVFVITGASSGIGAATARAAAQDGYRVVLGARSQEKLDDLARELGGDERALAVRCDVSEWEDQQRLIAGALEAYGRVDVMVANAGFGASRGFTSDDPEQWKAMVLTNVYGAALSIRAAAEPLKATKGHLVLMSSVAGRRALSGSLYSATKHAVTAMGEAARLDFNDTGVRVTVIEPGMVDTPFFEAPPQIEALQPEDIARAVMFAVGQPPHVDINEILVRPTAQPN